MYVTVCNFDLLTTNGACTTQDPINARRQRAKRAQRHLINRERTEGKLTLAEWECFLDCQRPAIVLLTSPRPLPLPLSGRNDELDLARSDDALPPTVQTHMHVHVRGAAAAAVRYSSDLDTCAVRAQSSCICKSVPAWDRREAISTHSRSGDVL